MAKAISKRETLEWVRKLYAAGIREYYSFDIPEHLQNHKYSRKAAYSGFVTWTGKKATYAECGICGNNKQWRIRDDIMNIKLYDAHR